MSGDTRRRFVPLSLSLFFVSLLRTLRRRTADRVRIHHLILVPLVSLFVRYKKTICFGPSNENFFPFFLSFNLKTSFFRPLFVSGAYKPGTRLRGVSISLSLFATLNRHFCILAPGRVRCTDEGYFCFAPNLNFFIRS